MIQKIEETNKCPICERRLEAKEELDQIEKASGEMGKFEREKRRTNILANDMVLMHKGVCESLQECPQCRKIMGSSTNFEWKLGKEIRTHSHKCPDCKIRLPREKSQYYEGDFQNDDLR